MPRKKITEADAGGPALADAGGPAMNEASPAQKKRPRVSVRERRFQNPFGESTPDIEFKDPTLKGRWFSEELRGGQQIYRAKKDLGWEHVTPDMIANLDSLGKHEVNPSNQIVRGARGSEYLMYMPKADYDKIQKAKTAENNRRMSNPNAQKQEMLETYGASNPLGAEYVDQKVTLHADVKTTHERIQRTGELE